MNKYERVNCRHLLCRSEEKVEEILAAVEVQGPQGELKFSNIAWDLEGRS